MPPELARDLKRFYRVGLPGPALHADASAAVQFEEYMPVGRAPYYIQNQYLIKNPYTKDQRYRLLDSKDGSQYSHIHSKYHPALLRIASKFGYRDFFLIDNETGRDRVLGTQETRFWDHPDSRAV